MDLYKGTVVLFALVSGFFSLQEVVSADVFVGDKIILSNEDYNNIQTLYLSATSNISYGTLNHQNGTIYNGLTGPGGTISGGHFRIWQGGRVNNYREFTNYNILELSEYDTVYVTTGTPGYFYNYGNTSNPFNLSVASFHNEGYVLLGGNTTFENDGSVLNAAVSSSHPTAIFDNGGGTIINNYSFENHVNGLIRNNGQFNNSTSGTLLNSGAIENRVAGIFTNTGMMINLGTAASLSNVGEFVNSGSFYDTDGGTLSHLIFDNQGTFTNSGTMELANTELASSGTFINSGVLHSSSTNDFDIENGVFTNAGIVDIHGDIIGANSTFNMNGGTVNFNGGNINVGTLAMATETGNTVSFTHDSGTVQTLNTMVGQAGTASFGQQGGGHTILGDLELASSHGSSGTYTLAGGTLVVGGSIVGGSGTSTFNYNGGVLAGVGTGDVTVTNLNIAAAVGSDVSSLMDDSVNLQTSVTTVGHTGTGLLSQQGGSHTTANLLVAKGINSAGEYFLNSGNLNVTGNEIIGGSGIGILTQTGGTHTVSGSITLAESTTINQKSRGIFQLRGGSLSVGSSISGGLGESKLEIEGGSLSANKIYNINTIEFKGGNGMIDADIKNTGNMTVSGGYNKIINGNVTNNGSLLADGVNMIFNGDMINNGRYESINGTMNYLSNFTAGETGFLVGSYDEAWHVSGNFYNNSLANTLWDTANAALFLTGTEQHMSLAGSDLGQSLLGYIDNFSWSSLSLGSGCSLHLSDGNLLEGAALYVRAFGDNGSILSQLTSIFSDYNIYYDPRVSSWLNGGTYALNGAGYLAPAIASSAAVPTPIPSAAWLFGSGLVGLIGLRRKKQ